MTSFYERHIHKEPDFPIIFHHDQVHSQRQDLTHWHENIELLFMRRGIGIVNCDTIPVQAAEGDLVIVNSSALHIIHSLTEWCEYDCLIADKTFCEEFRLPIGDVSFQSVVRHEEVSRHFDRIAAEMERQDKFYKTAVKAEVLSLMTLLFRIAVEGDLAPAQNNRLEMVRRSIEYIRQNYRQPLSVEDISAHAGFSKYYFCRVFREVTGTTVVDYINFLRCDHARKLLSTGMCNVSESAERSGFHNLSYFTRTYKQHIGALPSESLTKTQ